MKKYNNNKGISLISIIILGIIAVVILVIVIKAVSSGIIVLSKAQTAKSETKDAEIKENLTLLITSFKTDNYVSNSDTNIDKYLLSLKAEGKIQDFWNANDLAIIKYNSSYFCIKLRNNNWEVIGNVPFDSDGIASKSIENYKLSVLKDSDKEIIMENNNVYIISNLVRDNAYSYSIPENSRVTIAFFDDYQINNKNKAKPAIELGQNSTLDLYLYSTLNVSSLYNGNEKIIYNQVTPKGGFAGIYVPTQTTLNIYGTGQLFSYGGPAGKGGTYSENDSKLGSGGGGAGAGIGRKWWRWRFILS